MRLQNPQVTGQAGHVMHPSPERASTVNSRFIVTLQMILMIVVVFWLGVNLFFTLNPLQDPEIGKKLNQIASQQDALVDQFTEKDEIYIVDDVTALQYAATPATRELIAKLQIGDHIVNLEDGKTLIFRPQGQEVIYYGTKLTLLEDVVKSDLAAKILQKASQQGIVSGSNRPQLEFVEDVAAILRRNGVVFANADVGDVIAYFLLEGKIIVFDPETDTIIGSGNLNIAPIAAVTE